MTQRSFTYTTKFYPVVKSWWEFVSTLTGDGTPGGVRPGGGRLESSVPPFWYPVPLYGWTLNTVEVISYETHGSGDPKGRLYRESGDGPGRTQRRRLGRAPVSCGDRTGRDSDSPMVPRLERTRPTLQVLTRVLRASCPVSVSILFHPPSPGPVRDPRGRGTRWSRSRSRLLILLRCEFRSKDGTILSHKQFYLLILY